MREIEFTKVGMTSPNNEKIEVVMKSRSGQVEYYKGGVLHKVKEIPYTYGSKELLEDAKRLAKALKIDENTLTY